MKSLLAIKARLSAATPGPWGMTRVMCEATEILQVYSESTQNPECSGEWVAEPANRADQELIAHAPTDLARLIQALEKCMVQRDFGASPDQMDKYNAELAALLEGQK